MIGLTKEEFIDIYSVFRGRAAERDVRMAELDAVVRGEWSEVDPDNDAITSRSPNLIQVALEDTAEAAGTMPTVRVVPRKNTAALKAVAGMMEKVATGYFDHSEMDLLVIQTVMDLGAFGFAPWVVWPDFEERLPIIEKRDPRTCYPEPGLRPGQKVRRCLFSREVPFLSLPADYQALLLDIVTGTDGKPIEERLNVNLCEFFTETDVTVAAMFEVPMVSWGSSTVHVPVILDAWEHKLGACPVVVGSRFALDGEFRGQFDQVIGVLGAHVRLMAMVLDYADQAVYSDVWVKDLIGEMTWGGGAYIELGPQGAIGRVPPAVSALNIQQDLDRLVEAVHVGGRWPKSRPGEIDQAIASAKFVEATAGMLNTAIKTYHQLLQRMMEHAVRLCFMTDQQFFPGKKTVAGVLRNQQFVEEYDATSDIDMKNRIKIEYGIGLGRDPAQSAVLMIQYAKEGYISNEFVQESIEGLTDVTREKVRIDVEKIQGMLWAKMLQRIQNNEIPDSAVLDLMDARNKGEDVSVIYRKYVADAADQQAAASMPPGQAPPPGGMPPGGPPGAGEPIPPPPPDAAGMMSRLGVPAGNRQSFLSSTVNG